MSLHTDLAIYKQGTALLSLALDVQTQIPRVFRNALGAKITGECVELLVLIARANAARGTDRAVHIAALLERLEVTTFLLRVSHDKRLIAHKLWASSIELTTGIGNQAGGWLKSAKARTA